MGGTSEKAVGKVFDKMDETADCVAGDEKCVRRAGEEGKEAVIVQPGGGSATAKCVAKLDPLRCSSRVIPKFPWPPPRASATEVIPSESLESKTGATSLRDVERRIREVLEENGYFERRYYAVRDGFALVTRVEQINDDGTPKEGPQRWSLEVPRLSEFTLSAYLRALFLAPPGYYRVMVFIVTPYPIVQSEAKVTPEEAKRWLGLGSDRLPESIGALDFSRERYACTVLVYEFKRRTESDKPTILDPGGIPGRIHLMKAGLWEAFTR